MQPRLTTPRNTRDKINESLLYKDRINYPPFKDANGDTWSVYVQKDTSPPQPSEDPYLPPASTSTFVFNVYACCEFSLETIFMDKPELKKRIVDVLQTNHFRFLIHRAKIQEIFNDRLHEKIITHYESFKTYAQANTFISKKEKLVKDRFEAQFNFGGFL